MYSKIWKWLFKYHCLLPFPNKVAVLPEPPCCEKTTKTGRFQHQESVTPQFKWISSTVDDDCSLSSCVNSARLIKRETPVNVKRWASNDGILDIQQNKDTCSLSVKIKGFRGEWGKYLGPKVCWHHVHVATKAVSFSVYYPTVLGWGY